MDNKNNRQGMKWNKEETILAFELYCRTPFGLISSSNPNIIELASMLGRTPGSVALKMSNLAHFDPSLKARNVVGMSHGSKLDGEVFEEFSKNLEELMNQAEILREKLGIQELKKVPELVEVEVLPPGEYREQLRKERIGQYAFHLSVLTSYHERCCITGLNVPELLIARHIKPWADCKEKTERTNPMNGLCLNAFHDKAFDRGLITIDKNYNVIISTRLNEAKMDVQTKDWFLFYNGSRINLPDKFRPAKEFIEYHNDMVFQR